MLFLHALSSFYNILEVAPLSHKLLLLKTSASSDKSSTYRRSFDIYYYYIYMITLLLILSDVILYTLREIKSEGGMSELAP